MHTASVSLALVSCLSLTTALPNGRRWNNNGRYEHVAAFSIDGMHSSDVEKYLAVRPNSNISLLLKTGYEYTDAFTSAPSDSFPGTLAQYTGGTPAVHGVWYDATWDRSYYAANTTCSGPAGTLVDDTEDLDYDSTKLYSGGINPLNLPKKIVDGKCVPSYPHSRVRVNTVFEVIHSKGQQTAYTDKHPAYDLVRGPSGAGLTTAYFPEIAAIPGNNVPATIAYDNLHVNAFLDWLDAATPANSEGKLSAIPALFGGNFQAVNVAQKTYGYQNTSGNPFTPQLLEAFDAVDAALGAVVSKLEAKKIYHQTLIIVASKHGQAPINPASYQKVDPALITPVIGVPVQYETTDDIDLIYLNHSSDTAKAVANLNAHKAELKIKNIIYGQDLIDQGFGDPTTDPAVPDIIVQPILGVIYTTSTKKIAEHGGISDDDRKVACFVSSPKLRKQQFSRQVYTRQIAPTIVKALGYDPSELQAVQKLGTQALPGFADDEDRWEDEHEDDWE